MITRRCYQRTFRLRPSDETNHIYLYCLAWAAAKTGVEIHAACVMSNHHHLVLTDVYGTLPDFLRELHRTSPRPSMLRRDNGKTCGPPSPTTALSSRRTRM